MKHLLKIYILCAVLFLGILAVTACSDDSTHSEETGTGTAETQIPVTSTGSATDTDGYPYSFTLDDGTEKTIYFSDSDPADYAELHLAQLDDTGVPNRIVLHRWAGGTGVYIENAYVFDGTTGENLPVTPPEDIIAQYLTVDNTNEGWILHIGGAEYTISKEQFADYAADQIYETPDFSHQIDYSVENGQLYCAIGILCAGMGTGYAEESLSVRYQYAAGTDGTPGAVIPAEITFRRAAGALSGTIEEAVTDTDTVTAAPVQPPQSTPSVPPTQSVPTPSPTETPAQPEPPAPAETEALPETEPPAAEPPSPAETEPPADVSAENPLPAETELVTEIPVQPEVIEPETPEVIPPDADTESAFGENGISGA